MTIRLVHPYRLSPDPNIDTWDTVSANTNIDLIPYQIQFNILQSSTTITFKCFFFPVSSQIIATSFSCIYSKHSLHNDTDRD